MNAPNSGFESKITERAFANDGVSHLSSATQLAMVFVNAAGRIRGTTPAAEDLLEIRPEHIGLSLAELRGPLLEAGLHDEVALVLKGLGPSRQHLQTSDGRRIVRQVLPYRTADRQFAGAVVTFQDVTEFERQEALLRKREAQQAVVSQLGLRAVKAMNLGAYLDATVQEVQRTLGSDYCCILELQPAAGRLLLRAGLGWKQDSVGRAVVPARGATDPSVMLRSREPTLIHDLSAHLQLEPHELLAPRGLRSSLSTVIHDDRGVYGLICAYHEAKNHFTADDAAFLQAIANVVGSAVSACQTDLRAQLERVTSRLFFEPGDVAAVSARVLLQLGNALGADVCELWRKDDGSERLCCELFETPTAPDQRDQFRERLVRAPVERGSGLIGRTWSEGRAQWLASMEGESERDRVLCAMGLNDGMAFPIVTEHEPIGVMAFSCRQHLRWDDQMLEMLDKVGRSIGAFVTARRVAFDQAHLAAIVASSDDAILSKDLMGIVQSWNPGAERIYGYTAAEMIGKPVTILFPDHLKPQAISILEEIARGRRIQSHETGRVRKDGSHIDVSVTISPICGEDGRVVGASTIARDITDRKRAEKRLAEADRQKDQFLAMLGHELRNPLAAVRNAAELLKFQQNADPSTIRIREILDRQTRHMAHLMDGLLDVSRIIRNKIDLKSEAVDLGRVVREVVDDYLAHPQKNPPQLHLQLESDRVWVRGDSVRLTQIVDNLIGNAVKFTGREGSIYLRLAEHHAEAIFSVRDTGRGIAPDLLPHVFDVFRQAQQSLDRTSGGLGLGLALVKLLTELHGGSVEASSEGIDRGAEFVVRLPAIAAPVKTRAPLHAPATRTFDILVVEDNGDAATLLCELLEVAGHVTQLASSAEVAWEQLQRRTPDVVLCDLGLPGNMTGFDLARRIRSEDKFARMRLIALSGYGRPEDKAASREAGFGAHLTKPVDFDSLQSVLKQQAD